MGFMVASSDVRPLARAKPGIEGIVVATVGLPFMLDFDFVYSSVVNPICGVVNVDEGWNRDSPGDLPRNIPIFNVIEIVYESFFLAGWVEFYLPFFKRFDGAFR